jgi:Ca2+-binding RTX toxin-like protein
MATITGSTAVDWSSVSFPSLDWTGGIALGLNRAADILSGYAFFIAESVTPTTAELQHPNGGTLTLSGSRFSLINIGAGIVTFARFEHPAGELLELIGNFDATAPQSLAVLTYRATANAPIYTATMVLSINSATGVYTGTLQRVEITLDSGYTIELTSPNYALSGNAVLQTAVDSLTATRFTTLRIASPDDLSTITLAGRTFTTAQIEALGDFLETNGFDAMFSAAFANTYLGGNDSVTYVDPAGASLHGGPGNDTLTGGSAVVDTLTGGHGHDTYIMDGSSDAIVELANQGADTATSSTGSIVLSAGAHVENVTLTGTSSFDAAGNELANNVVGNSGVNSLSGGAGNDTLTGGLGSDTLAGGADDDLYILASAADLLDTISEGGGGGFDTVRLAFNVAASTTYVLGSEVEAAVVTGTGLFHLTGNAANNALTGNASANSLDGGAGDDTLTGGGLNDTYFVDSGNDEIVEIATGGVDTARSTASAFTLDANVEHLVLLAGAGSGAGNTSANNITGNDDANTLDGSGGNDTLTGAGGGDSLQGGLQNDVLSGGAGNDTLDGGTGNDTLTGGLGDDLYIVDVATDRVNNESTLDGGNDTVQSAVSFSLAALTQIENLTLTGAALNATGNTLGNILTGTTANNSLDGALGADTMIGGLGDDTYVFSAMDDVATENPGEGIDTLRLAFNVAAPLIVDLAFVDYISLDNAIAVGTGEFQLWGNSRVNALTGNASANVLGGQDGNDTLDGGLGNDTMLGGADDDTYVLSAALDVVDEEANADTGDTVRVAYAGSVGLDTLDGGSIEHATLVAATALHLTGNAADNRLEGNAINNSLVGGLGVDTLIGNAGNDTLDGGGGGDEMSGGAGNDVYRIDDAADVVSEATAGAAGGIDTVHSAIDLSVPLFANVEHLTLVEGSLAEDGEGNTLANTLTGNSSANSLEGAGANDSLVGNGGNDTLDGGIGNDTMSGGAGDDTFLVEAAADVVSETLNGGNDTIQSAVTYSIAALANVEHLTLTGAGHVNATGNGGANILTGNTGNNSIVGGTGNDTLSGSDGNDTLDGGLGDDVMVGGIGDDTFVFSAFTDVATEGVGEGADTVRLAFTVAAGTTVNLADAPYTNIENVIASGTGFSEITGTGANNALTGNAAANTLTGAGGDDTLDGGAGTDSMIGGTGNDTYVLSSALDQVLDTGGDTGDTVRVGYAASINLNTMYGGNIEHATLLLAGTLTLTGTASDNRLEGAAGNDSILGASGADTLIGNAGNDTLDGNTGIDSMAGGAGNDVYRVDDASDVVSEVTAGAAGGIDRVESALSFDLTAVANVENVTLTGIGNFNATGNTLNNALVGNSGNNSLTGGAGNDTMTGGLGDDTYLVDAAGDQVIEGLNAGTDLVSSTVTYSIAALGNVERLTLTGVANINATGNGLANILTGNTGNNSIVGGAGNDNLNGGDGNDTLDGGLGNDVMAGGIGDDTFILNVVTDTFSDTGGTADTVRLGYAYTGATITLGAGIYAAIENAVAVGTGLFFINGSAAANALTGNASNNTLNGGAGNDTLDGGAGTDSMVGGANDDTFVLSAATDSVSELGGGGTDTVRIAYAGSVNLGAANLSNGQVENATLIVAGTAALNLTGTAANNRLEGHGGNNSLDGAGGTDTLIGGAGNDTLEGGTGVDVMEGGTGNDVYRVTDAGEAGTITELLNGGTDRVESAITFSLATLGNIENLTLTPVLGIGNFNATGNALNNVLTGNAGNNSLDGGTGNDTMIGGAGNDTYVVDAVGDVVTETGGGTDTIQSSVTRSLAALTQVEHLTLTGVAAINATGNALANTLTGNAGNNSLDGGAGVDSMVGGGGDDTYTLDSALDVVNDSSGTDTVRLLYTPVGATTINLGSNYGGAIENLIIVGATPTNAAKFTSLIGNGADNLIVTSGEIATVDGGGGNDSIDMGLLNNQSLTGGIGDDRFIFSAAYRASATSAADFNVKLIQDFVVGEDTLVLDVSFFTGSGVPGALAASAFVSGAGVSVAQYATDRVIYNTDTGNLYYDPDGTGAATAVRIAVLDPGLALSSADFELIA